MIANTTPRILVTAIIAISCCTLAQGDDPATNPTIFPSTVDSAAEEPSMQTETLDDPSQKKGKISVELTIDNDKDKPEDDDKVTVVIKKDGRELSGDETDAELEQWEQELMERLDDVFRDRPRKGIFALQQDRDGGFAELGFGLKSSDGLTMMREGYEGLEFAAELNAGLQISGLFYEYFSASGNRGILGLNFFNNDWAGLDIIVGKEHRNFADDKEDGLLLPINVRHADWTGGLRSTLYIGPVVLQGQIRREITDYHNGYTASLQTGTNIQIRNLNIHAVVGASYQSEEVMDYYYGVTAAEQTARFNQYDPNDDLTYNAEIGASYPMSENWVLRGQVNYKRYSDDIINSPFWDGNSADHVSSRLMLLLVL